MAALGRALMPCIPAPSCASTSGRCPEACLPGRGACNFQPRYRQIFCRPDSRTQLGTCRRRGALQVAALAPKRGMSFQQRMRAVRTVLTEQGQQLRSAVSALPPIAVLLQLAALLDRKLQPLYAFIALMRTKAEELGDSYNNFVAEETKRRWNWENKHQKEIDFWKSVPPYLFFFGCTVLYEVMVPVSVLAALALPLYYAWVVWDRWWVSPVFLATCLMTPLKFVPWADIFWVWPGLI